MKCLINVRRMRARVIVVCLLVCVLLAYCLHKTFIIKSILNKFTLVNPLRMRRRVTVVCLSAHFLSVSAFTARILAVGVQLLYNSIKMILTRFLTRRFR